MKATIPRDAFPWEATLLHETIFHARATTDPRVYSRLHLARDCGTWDPSCDVPFPETIIAIQDPRP